MSNAFDKASLVMLPHAYEDGKLYSLKPTDRSGDFTFSRGSDTATRVGEDGYIKKETANLLLQSNNFDTTWLNANSTETGGQAGYDGSNNAWLVTTTVSGGYIRQSLSVSGINTFSIYVKADNGGGVKMIGIGGSNPRVPFNLTDGTITDLQGDVVHAEIQSIGNGWYRCSIITDDSLSELRIYPQNVGDTSSVGNSIYIQDAQLNQGLVAQDYLETTTAPVYGGLTDNMPRLDYTDATCPSLLLEPQRTNLVGSSEYFDSYWSKSRLSVSTNVAISPEGLMNASKLTEDSTNQYHYIIQAFGAANSGSHITSVYAKSAERSHIMLWNSGSNSGQIFNIDSGTKGGVIGNAPLDSSIEPVGNEWYRCSIYNDNVLGSAVYIASSNTSAFYQGDGTSGVYIYGMQVEQDASYPTSYIPTYGSSQTRAVDNLTSTPLSINGLFGATSGSIFMEFTNPLQGLSNNWFYMTGEPAGGSGASMRVRGYWQMNMPGLTWNPTSNLGSLNNATKVAVKWGGGVAKLFIDGSENAASTYTGGDINMSVSLSSLNGSFNFAKNNANFKQILFFQEALSDSELQALTTL